jgi:hypothetical protein
MPILTIVTGLLEGDENIHATVDSVLPQLGQNTSWIIKESSQSLSESILRYNGVAGVHLIGQKDSSLYEGLNHALRRVDGEFFMVLGAGDTLEPGALDFICHQISTNPSLDAFYFAIRLNKDGRIFGPNPSEIQNRMACPHPGAVLSTQKTLRIGGFDESYQIASDYDLLCRYIKTYGRSGWSNQPVVNFKGGGLSEHRAIEGFLEEELIRIRVWNSPISDVCSRGARFFVWAHSQLEKMASGHRSQPTL